MAQGKGFLTTPSNAFLAAWPTPCWPAPSKRDSAMQSDVVMTMSMTMVTMAGPAAAVPSKATNKGTPMKPVLGKAPTKAPNAASFQPKRLFKVMATTKATMTKAQNKYMKKALASNNCAMGVLAPNWNSMQGSAKNSTKPFKPGMASKGNIWRRAAQ